MVTKTFLLVMITTFVCVTINFVDTRNRRSREKFPKLTIDKLHTDPKSSLPKSRYNRKASECIFGEKSYELGAKWNPDLGPPFGVMYCMHCECVTVNKKRRIIGKTKCQSIKEECPKPNCANPILLPNRCCKVCEGQKNNPDLEIKVDLQRESEEQNSREFAALLTGSSVVNSVLSPPENIFAGTARFHIRKKSLSYTFVFSSQFGWPKQLSFLDQDDNIIEEFPVYLSNFQIESGKLCGSWDRMPKNYRQALRDQQIYVQLMNINGEVIKGKIGKYYGLTSEIFSGLLLPTNGNVGAATSIVSVNPISRDKEHIHIMLLLADIFGDHTKEIPLVVILRNQTKTLKKEFTIPLVNNATANVDFTIDADEYFLNDLGTGNLEITVFSQKSQQFAVSGIILPRFQCDIFDSVLAIQSQQNKLIKPTPASLVYISVDYKGIFRYHIKTDKVNGKIDSVTIDNNRKKLRKIRIIDVEHKESEDGIWVNGTIKMNGTDIRNLYQDKLYMRLITSNKELYQGRIISRQASKAHQSLNPILLQGNSTQEAGIAWTQIDWSCTLNYEVQLSSKPKTPSKLYLRDYPMSKLPGNNRMPARTALLKNMDRNHGQGSKSRIHKLSLARINAGDGSIRVESRNFSLEGRISGLQVPNDCLPRYARKRLEMMPGFLNDLGDVRPEAENELENRCLYEDEIYEEGHRWEATHRKCQMCSCHRGQVKCQDQVCPVANCSQPIILEGECCASCNNNLNNFNTQNQRGCVLGEKFHPAGSKWHPFVPPFGFSRCVTCTCEADTLGVKCSKKSCPNLDSCPHERQVINNPLECCPICRESTKEEIEFKKKEEENKLQLANDEETFIEENLLENGGCKFQNKVFENGYSWHPTIQPIGLMTCIKCTCKNGTSDCKNKTCEKLKCEHQFVTRKKCCPQCAQTSDEIRLAKKQKRRKIRKFKQRKSRTQNNY